MSEPVDNEAPHETDAHTTQNAQDQEHMKRAAEIKSMIMNDPKKFKNFVARASQNMGSVDISSNPMAQEGLLNVASNWLTRIEMQNRRATKPNDIIEGLMLGLEYMDNDGKPAPRGRTH